MRYRGTQLYLKLRTGRTVIVDASQALAGNRAALFTIGRPVRVRALIEPDGAVHAQLILQSHILPAFWPPDH